MMHGQKNIKLLYIGTCSPKLWLLLKSVTALVRFGVWDIFREEKWKIIGGCTLRYLYYYMFLKICVCTISGK